MAEKKPIRVCWISGNRKESEEVLNKLRKSAGECEEIRYGSEILYSTLEDRVLSDDCFGSKRFIIVTELPQPVTTRPTMLTHLKQLISAVPADCLLVFYGIPPDEERPIFSHVAKEGRVFDFPAFLSFVDSENRLKELLSAADKEFDSKVIHQLICDLTSSDGKTYSIDQLALTSQKLLAYLGNRKTISLEDVEAVSTCLQPANIGQLFDALDDRNFDRAWVVSRRLCDYEMQGDWAALCTKLIGISIWRYRLMAFIKEAKHAGMSDREVIAAATTLHKIDYSGTGGGMVTEKGKSAYTDVQVIRLLEANFGVSPIEKYSRKRMISILEHLNDGTDNLRSVVTGESPYIFWLDLFLLIACDKLDDNRKERFSGFFRYDNE